MQAFRFVLACVAMVFVTGCASTRQFVPLPDQSVQVEDATKARVYVVRPTIFGGAIPMTVSDGDQAIGKTGASGYLCWEREPGETTLKSKAENTAELPLKTEAGVVYYIQQHVRMGFLIARTKLSQMTAADGQKAVAACKPPKVEAGKK